MKAIIVVDVPDYYKLNEISAYCSLYARGQEILLKNGNHFGVKPLPKKDLLSSPFSDDGGGTYASGRQDGWNACIDEILGENRMKEMTYSDARHREWLVHDTYKGIEFVIMNLGTHPTAYIGVDKNSKFYGDSDIDLNVHGGVTYTSSRLLNEQYEECLSGKWWIGWDYAHCDDYLPFLGDYGKRWTTQEILEDVKSAIDEILGETE